MNLVSFARFRTLSVVPTIPVAGMALILGIDRFMSEARALVNVIGNGVATIVISRTEGELDLARLNAVLEGRAAGADEEAVPADLVDGTPLPSRNQA
ncbi:Na+/H+-dicarboxylate symporter [Bradyrhizobium japonicum]